MIVYYLLIAIYEAPLLLLNKTQLLYYLSRYPLLILNIDVLVKLPSYLKRELFILKDNRIKVDPTTITLADIIFNRKFHSDNNNY